MDFFHNIDSPTYEFLVSNAGRSSFEFNAFDWEDFKLFLIEALLARNISACVTLVRAIYAKDLHDWNLIQEAIGSLEPRRALSINDIIKIGNVILPILSQKLNFFEQFRLLDKHASDSLLCDLLWFCRTISNEVYGHPNYIFQKNLFTETYDMDYSLIGVAIFHMDSDCAMAIVCRLSGLEGSQDCDPAISALVHRHKQNQSNFASAMIHDICTYFFRFLDSAMSTQKKNYIAKHLIDNHRPNLVSYLDPLQELCNNINTKHSVISFNY